MIRGTIQALVRPDGGFFCPYLNGMDVVASANCAACKYEYTRHKREAALRLHSGYRIGDEFSVISEGNYRYPALCFIFVGAQSGLNSSGLVKK